MQEQSDFITGWQGVALEESIETLGLSPQCVASLRNAGIQLISELASWSQTDLLLSCNLTIENSQEIETRMNQFLESNDIPKSALRKLRTHRRPELRPQARTTLTQRNSSPPRVTNPLDQDIGILNLSPRSYNSLRRAGINFVRDIASKTSDDLLAIRNLGQKCLVEITTKLRQYLQTNGISQSAFLGAIQKHQEQAERPIPAPEAPTDSEQSLTDGESLSARALLTIEQLLELSLLEAVRYTHLSAEDWGELVADCKPILAVAKEGPLVHISNYAKSIVPTDKRLAPLDVRTRNVLRRQGIYDLNSLYSLKVKDWASFRNVGRKSTVELFDLLQRELPNYGIQYLQKDEIAEEYSKEMSPSKVGGSSAQPMLDPYRAHFAELQRSLNDEIQSGRIDSRIMVRGHELADWVKTDPEVNGSGLQIPCDRLESLLSKRSIDEELEGLFGLLRIRRLKILASRYGYPEKTLQELADDLGVTRERIRQMENKVRETVAEWLLATPPCRIQTAIMLAQDMGTQISISKWESTLAERGLLKNDPLRIPDGVGLGFTSLQLMLSVLRATEKVGVSFAGFRIPDNLRTALEHPGFTAEEIKAAERISKKALNSIRRQCRNVGAVSTILLSRQLKIAAPAISKALELHNYIKLDNEWWATEPVKGRGVSSYHSAFQANVAKAVSICGPLPLETVRRGLQNHASRSGFAVPPVSVLRKLLPMYGFKIDSEGQVLPMPRVKIQPNSGEKAILGLMHRQGWVLNFQEMLEEFFKRKLSQPLLSATLRYSVLFDRVDLGVYCLRGARISRDDVESALARRPEVEQNGAISFGQDGIVTWSINVGVLAIGGTIPAGEASRLTGEWKGFVGSKQAGWIKIGEQQIWGLAKAFRFLKVRVGDRMALHFDTRTRQVRIEKVRDRDAKNETD